ncbi:hypothetical protein [Prochlorococcus marinus]|uniref:hypothetical protein n=1 Tax=Prochlorococcus TaxID=1218 RepID=UPI0007BAED03|nr:hypothetical protein [Prochlorococcus marinus]KZR74339.1 hypothetical protein PMIT1323_02301 [Prochlorococcus marinus str. MIT 1323]
MLFRLGFVDEKDVEIKVLTPRMIRVLNDYGAIYSRINVGYFFQVEQSSVDHCRALDLMNYFSSGVGKM